MKHFRPGSAVFKCVTCGRGTRETGVQSLGNKNCPQCYELAGLENEVSDGYKTLAEGRDAALAYIADIEAKGGDASEWRTVFNAPKEDR